MNLILPIGVMHEGTLLRDFALRKPKGGLRAELQDAPNHAAGFDLAALRHVVASLGPITNPNDQILRRLTAPDRDYLHACCTANRYNGMLPVQVKCDCGEEVKDEVELAKVELSLGKGELRYLEGRAAYDLEFDLPSSGQHTVVTVAVPTIGVELRHAERRAELTQQKKPLGEADLERLANSILSWSGERGPTARVLRDMDLDDFDALTKAMGQLEAPGLDDEAELVCQACSRHHTVPIQFDWWLLPFDPRTGRAS
jgi:hypothetical protein